jgi:hypothetical protein
MRGIAKDFDTMLIRCPCGMLTGNYILQHNRSSRPADPRHLGDNSLRRHEVMNGKPADYDVELMVREGELLHIASDEGQIL